MNSFQSSRFLGAIKQYLCLSLLKNSASAHLIVFQLSCSIFMSLISRFRPGLKAEIGVFFPMIVLRVLENVAQPNFQQKMIVLCFFEKLCVDSQILVDIFINYDCDVHSSNIFERYVCFFLTRLGNQLTFAMLDTLHLWNTIVITILGLNFQMLLNICIISSFFVSLG